MNQSNIFGKSRNTTKTFRPKTSVASQKPHRNASTIMIQGDNLNVDRKSDKWQVY
jgi:hypothetical protein